MNYSYYPGCSLCSTASEYNLSCEAICAKLDINLKEIPDWNCCGATVAHAVDSYLAVALPLRNLVLAEPQGRDVVVPCAACYHWLRVAHREVVAQTHLGQRANQEIHSIMGMNYQGSLDIKHILQILLEPRIMEILIKRLEKPLTGLKLAAYYGCLMLRPSGVVAFDNPEQPVTLDKLCQALGAETVRWSSKVDCCGGSFTLAESGLVGKLTSDLVAAARRGGADAIVTACPLCQANLDTRQQQQPAMPVFYITELVGVALGIGQSNQWFKKHITDPLPLLQRKGLV